MARAKTDREIAREAILRIAKILEDRHAAADQSKLDQQPTEQPTSPEAGQP